MSIEGVETDFRRQMSYSDYLGLAALLSAQKPLSPVHDEMLFIIMHQVQELWMKLLLHEMDLAIDRIRADDLRPAFKATARISRIQAQMGAAWDVLSTMTPHDYLAFRDHLGSSSGFQSWQYRACEFRMGAKSDFMLKPHAHDPALMDKLIPIYEAPSLYDEALRLLARRGIPLPPEVTERDWRQPYAAHPAVEAAWEAVYRNAERFFDLYELAEELVDIEDQFRVWRFRHLTTVERIIGMRRGTGGSPGVPYLRAVLEKPFFPELWSVRTRL